MLVGLVFMILAALCASVALSEWMDYRNHPITGLIHITTFLGVTLFDYKILAGFSLFLTFLGIYTLFVKVRNVR
jgi:uncharacterized membrane protein